MRFLVDECVGPTVAQWLRQEGHEVFSVYEAARGTEDADILRKANDEKWILITTDKDFGEQVFRERRRVNRVTLSRLLNGRAGVSPTMALALERIGWSNADHWIRMQGSYDLAQARLRESAA